MSLTLTSVPVSCIICPFASCLVHIFYIIRGRDAKFGMWMYFRVSEFSALFLCQCDLDLNRLPDFYSNLVRSISPKIFEVGISNFGV